MNLSYRLHVFTMAITVMGILLMLIYANAGPFAAVVAGGFLALVALIAAGIYLFVVNIARILSLMNREHRSTFR